MSGSVLYLIPARGGSLRLPGKNLRTMAGIPLVGRAARVARAAAAATPGTRHRVVCSTDDADIARVAAAWGAEVLERPASLATAETPSADVARHALDVLGADAGFETLVLLQPTSPLTVPDDVVAAVARHRIAQGAGVVSVTPTHPAAWHLAIGGDGRLQPVVADGDVLVTGAFYVITPDDLRRTGRFVEAGRTLGQVVSPDRSVDVDEPEDLIVAEAILAARSVTPVMIGGHVIGAGRALVIAEAGVNHGGDVEMAHRLVDAAAAVGADVVKFQTFDPDALAAAGAPQAAYQAAAGHVAADQRALLAGLTLPDDAWPALQAHARERGIEFLSTPFDDRSAELLDRLDVPAFKVGSGELTNLPFLARIARFGRPLLVSTGMAEMTEVAAAVDTVALASGAGLVLLHCVSSYPAAPTDANLRAMETMRLAFGLPVGWSDHTVGAESALAAVALGAAVVEKHLTLDRGLPGPDHAASMEPDVFAALVASIRDVEAALGSGIKSPAAGEADVARVARRSLHWRRSLKPRTAIEVDDLEALRPGTGLSPGRMHEIVGRRTTVAVRSGEIVRQSDVEGLA